MAPNVADLLNEIGRMPPLRNVDPVSETEYGDSIFATASSDCLLLSGDLIHPASAQISTREDKRGSTTTNH
jgi:hypothetical protein